MKDYFAVITSLLNPSPPSYLSTRVKKKNLDPQQIRQQNMLMERRKFSVTLYILVAPPHLSHLVFGATSKFLSTTNDF